MMLTELVAKQQNLASDNSCNPLSEADVLQRILGCVGPGHWLSIALVSKVWRESYLLVPEQQATVKYFQSDTVPLHLHASFA
jgi:hypothetical protein